jgi:hypothetical protein
MAITMFDPYDFAETLFEQRHLVAKLKKELYALACLKPKSKKQPFLYESLHLNSMTKRLMTRSEGIMNKRGIVF